MAAKSETKKRLNVKKTRTYNVSPEMKLNSGQPWILHFEIAEDVGRKIISLKTKNGGEYGKIINAKLRKAFGIKEI